MKTALMCTIYHHSMDLAANARLATSIGQTTTLMSVDTEKLYIACQGVHFVWMTPLMTTCVGGLLASIVGFAALAGWMLIVIMWPMQQFLAKKGGRARRTAMRFTDERLKFMNEIIQGIRVAKLCAWEDAIFQRTTGTRLKEVKWLARSLLFKAVVREGILIILPPAVLAVMFGIERARGESLDETEALTALGMLNILRFPFNLFAMSLASAQDAFVSCDRIGEFLQRPVLRREMESLGPKLASIDVSAATFTWGGTAGATEAFTISVDSLRFEGSARIAVVGRVAAGKTSLLAALLGEMQRTSGAALLNGLVAYMGQAPWIQNMSLRSNVVFGHTWDEDLYRRAIVSAALEPDLAILKDGDLTDIGERGINLSGGQKARVCLARCLYAVAIGACNIMILDCPFDALDIPTGQSVFEGMMALAGSAMMICSMSAQVQLLHHFDRIVVIEGGRIGMQGSFAEVSGRYKDLVGGIAATTGSAIEAPLNIDDIHASIERAAGGLALGSKESKALMGKDASKSGEVSLHILLKHWGGAVNRGAFAGAGVGMGIAFIFLASQGFRVASDIVLTKWASEADLGMLAFSLLGSCILLLALRICGFTVVYREASATLHRRIFWRVLRAPVPEFFDVTTSGEIVNKFGKDLEITDTLLPESCMQFISNFSQLLVIMGLLSYAIPWFCIVLAALLALFYFLSTKFGAVSRDLKRLDGSTRSPIYNSFSETLAGLETIRAWGVQERFLAEHMKRVTHNLRFFHAASMSEIWIMVRLEGITIAIIGGFAFFAVALRDNVAPGLVGLALAYAIQLTAMFQRTCQLTIMIKQQMTACERVFSFENVFQEPPFNLEADTSLPPGWPCGEVCFEAVEMRYRDGDLVLYGVSFKALAGERIGICGRTGAGKSSLISVLFRIVEPCGGRVCIDGIDIRKLGLHTLRSSLSIIPQEPVLFSGTIRANLDPFGIFRDDVILVEALRSVGLSPHSMAVYLMES